MSYRCQLCRFVVPDRKTRLLHIVYGLKPDGFKLTKQIEREIPVCKRCRGRLDAGESLEALLVNPVPAPQPVAAELPTPAPPAVKTIGEPIPVLAERPKKLSRIKL